VVVRELTMIFSPHTYFKLKSPVAAKSSVPAISRSPRQILHGLLVLVALLIEYAVIEDSGDTITIRGCALDSGTLTTDTEIIRMSHCGSFYYEDRMIYCERGKSSSIRSGYEPTSCGILRVTQTNKTSLISKFPKVQLLFMPNHNKSTQLLSNLDVPIVKHSSSKKLIQYSSKALWYFIQQNRLSDTKNIEKIKRLEHVFSTFRK
ncbi:unnamed protein product, partial [Nesidiocoris tenuis]